ncbi:hypothetical protein SSS_04394 [Sarcoptes scabiei]|uniref:Uncharacterized protein n=1 Tax=Sarcoptes scabiei TaxID=52283 RepID=A0A132A599_SARSC|nr:hypothetical protein SSS_04394 [Sarcoptes scabiei]KPM05610.1 hypothetical protein QR98_0040750 [Sarcoptes scabiei]UXI18566.1 major abundant protein BTP1 [Sarcoptes scabiei]
MSKSKFLIIIIGAIVLNVGQIRSLRMQEYHDSPKHWGYKTEIHHPHSYVYHERYFPKISKSFYESDSYDHRPYRKLHHYFEDNDYEKPKQIIHHHYPKPEPYKPPPSPPSKKEDDAIKINFEIPMKKMFDKSFEKEIMGEKIGEQVGYGKDDEHGPEHHHGYEKKEEKSKEFDIQIPKFDIDGMLDKIKEKI